MKKYICSALSAILLLIVTVLPVCAAEYPKPTNDFFVNDFAGVISSEDKQEIMKIAASLYKQTTAQVVVVTVDSLDGKDVNDYALELGREWGVGQNKENNGVVLLLAVSERKVTIQVGYGLEGCLPDGKVGRILDNYALPYFSEDNFSTGITEAFKAVTTVVYDEYGVEPEIVYNPNELPDENSSKKAIETVIILIVLFLCSGFLRRRRAVFFGPFIGGGRGGFGGSSGGSRGGFSGGGGSFGGGGASRGF